MPDTPQIRSVSYRTNDLEESEERQAASIDWDVEFFRMAPGPFETRLDLIAAGERQIFLESWSNAFRYQGTAPSGSYGLGLPVAQTGPGSWVGARTDIDTVMFQAPGQEADLLSPQALQVIGLAVPEPELRATVAALTGSEGLCESLHGAVPLHPVMAGRLRSAGRDILRRHRCGSPADSAWIARAAEQFVKLFLCAIVGAGQAEQEDEAGPEIRSAEIVRRATALVLDDETSAMGLTEICAALEISLRNLHYAFREVTGMPPATWLRRIRLNRVHKTLLRAAPGEVWIKRVALEHGFLHLGHFGQQYRQLHGCLPSETLRAS